MENMELCQQCDEQPSNDMPHEVLREISKLPDVSTLYLCRECRNLWLCDVESGWHRMQSKSLVVPSQ